MLLPLMGFTPSELFPALELYRARRLAIPSRCSIHRPEGLRLHPQGFLSERNPYPSWEYCIPRRTDALLGFHRFHGVLESRAGGVSRRLIRS